ncbi:hypothetical protein D3C80_1530150 [compost metagenome]
MQCNFPTAINTGRRHNGFFHPSLVLLVKLGEIAPQVDLIHLTQFALRLPTHIARFIEDKVHAE